MGVLVAPSQVVSDAADAAASGMADTAVSQAVLKPMQIQEVESKRRKYLEQMPDMQGEDAQKSVKKLLGSIGIEVYQAYLEMLEPHHKLYSPVDAVPATFDADNRIRFFDITCKLHSLRHTAVHKNVAVLVFALFEAVFIGYRELFSCFLDGMYPIKPINGWIRIVLFMESLSGGVVCDNSHEIEIIL